MVKLGAERYMELSIPLNGFLPAKPESIEEIQKMLSIPLNGFTTLYYHMR